MIEHFVQQLFVRNNIIIPQCIAFTEQDLFVVALGKSIKTCFIDTLLYFERTFCQPNTSPLRCSPLPLCSLNLEVSMPESAVTFMPSYIPCTDID